MTSFMYYFEAQHGKNDEKHSQQTGKDSHLKLSDFKYMTVHLLR